MVDPETADAESRTVTAEVHENSWSANLEGPEHAADRELILEEALKAIEHTAGGYHVNLVTHATHGHPETYLYEVLDREGSDDLTWAYVDQCGCGGHVLRVSVP